MSEKESPPRSGLAIFAIGALIGAGIALLYAPQSGQETRKLIAKKARQLRDKTQDTIESAQGFIHDRKADLTEALDTGKASADHDHAKHKRT